MSTPYVGEIKLLPFNRTPTGYKLCDGSLLPIAQYEVLYTLIGTTYGGDGTTTFALPDLRGCTPIHQGQGPGLTNRVLGERGGSEEVTLLTTNMVQHTHPLMASTTATTSAGTSPTGNVFGATPTDPLYAADTTSTAFAPAPAVAGTAGSGIPHDNSMQTLVSNYFIAWAGVFPSQN